MNLPTNCKRCGGEPLLFGHSEYTYYVKCSQCGLAASAQKAIILRDGLPAKEWYEQHEDTRAKQAEWPAATIDFDPRNAWEAWEEMNNAV